MIKRTLALLVVALLGAACGGEDETGSPTAARTATPTIIEAAILPAPSLTPSPSATAPPSTWTPRSTLTEPPRITAAYTPRPTNTPFIPPTYTPFGGEGLATPPDLAPITATNAAQVVEVGAWLLDSAQDFAWSPDGRILAVAMRDGVRLYGNADFDSTPRFLEDKSKDNWIAYSVNCVDFSPDGTTLISANDDGELLIWDVNAYTPRQVIQVQDVIVHDCAFSPDGTQIATGASLGAIEIWDAATGARLQSFDRSMSVSRLAWSPDGTLLATGSGSSSYVVVVDLERAIQLDRIGGQASMLPDVAFSPDGKLLVTGDNRGSIYVCDTGQLEDETHIAVLEGPEGTIQRLAFSPDGTILVAGWMDGTLHFWDMATYQELTVIDAHDSGIDALSFSPDGTRLVTSGFDSMVRIWGVPTQ